MSDIHPDDNLPPEHPAGFDAPVSAGEVLSGEGTGTGRAGAASPTPEDEPSKDRSAVDEG
jgi:hypothetical protein